MGTQHFIEFINDAIYHKTYKYRDFIDHYRFVAYGEKYLDLKRKADIHNLQLFAPVYIQKRILAEHLKKQADEEDFQQAHLLLFKLFPRLKEIEKSELKLPNTDSLTMVGLSWDEKTIYAGGYDNMFHLLENFESENPQITSFKLINTPLCLKTWKDSWLLLGGKGFMQVYSIQEKELMHSWNPNTEDAKKNKVELDVTEMYVLPDYTILCTCTKGYMQIHGFSSPRLRLFQLDNDADINDMEICLTPESIPKDMKTLEIALATEQGVQFVAVHIEGGYEISQLEEHHRKSDTIKCLCRIKDNIFLLGV